MGSAEVYMHEGAICFTITHEEFKHSVGDVNYNGYVVYEKTPNEQKKVWGYYYTKKIIPLKEGECLSYGTLPEGAEIDSDKDVKLPDIAPALQMDTVYSLVVRARPSTDYTWAYFIEFCLQRNGKEIIIHQGRQKFCDDGNKIKKPLSKF
jgi:hypothetical protein